MISKIFDSYADFGDIADWQKHVPVDIYISRVRRPLLRTYVSGCPTSAPYGCLLVVIESYRARLILPRGTLRDVLLWLGARGRVQRRINAQTRTIKLGQNIGSNSNIINDSYSSSSINKALTFQQVL